MPLQCGSHGHVFSFIKPPCTIIVPAEFFSPGKAYYLLRAKSQLRFPLREFPNRFPARSSLPEVPWKTGAPFPVQVHVCAAPLHRKLPVPMSHSIDNDKLMPLHTVHRILPLPPPDYGLYLRYLPDTGLLPDVRNYHYIP